MKRLSLEDLAEKCKILKTENKKVIHCHGCFDLLHIGHLRHFKQAKEYGDFLVITVTPDLYVNKGINRPAFNEHLRCEMLEALEVVDYLAINKWETAVNTINMLKPDYYVKGPDYSNLTANKNLNDELEACTRNEVIIKYTDDELTSSSTYLIKNFMQ